MAITITPPLMVGGEATASRKTKIIVDPRGTIDVELIYGNYTPDGTFVPIIPETKRWAKITGDDFVTFSSHKPNGAKSYYDNVSDDLDAFINRRGL